MEIAYILQIITIAITLFLGVVTFLQTRRIQHGQNIIAVTTKYRGERTEQMKDAGAALLANTSCELLLMSEDPEKMLMEATKAAEKIGVIMHRNFEADKELIALAYETVDVAIQLVKSKGKANKNELCRLRDIFRLKCDLYSVADWNRIKEETKGENTSSQSWIAYYAKLEEEFKDEFDAINRKYGA